MTHWIILPIVLPALMAPFIVLAARYHIGIQRFFSLGSVVACRFRTVVLWLPNAFHPKRADQPVRRRYFGAKRSGGDR